MQFRLLAAAALLAVAGMGTTTSAVACDHSPSTPTDCRYTQGYWEHRALYAGNMTSTIWVALRPASFYQSGLTYGQVLALSPRGNAYWILAQQMVAAQANKLNGADTTGAPATALARAIEIMGAVTPSQIAALPRSSALRQEMIRLAATLDAWNNGVIGTGKCNVGGDDTHTDT